MTAWRSVCVGVFLLLSCAMLVLFFGRPSGGEAAAPAPLVSPPTAQARYQMVVEQRTVFICDTHTGQVWCRASALPGVDEWSEMKSPAMKGKK